MKIIKQGFYSKNPIQQFKCTKCGCIFEVDTKVENLDHCPCCGIGVSDLLHMNSDKSETECKKPKTPDEVFPDCYYKYGFNDGEKILSVQETQDLIRRCIEIYFGSDGGYTSLSNGDTLVFITQNNKDRIDDYNIVVTKNYYDLDSYKLLDE